MNEKVIVVEKDFVIFGELIKIDFKDVTLVNHKILHRWEGSLHSLATNGVVNPKKCVFSESNPSEIIVKNAKCIVLCSEKVAKSIDEIPSWIHAVPFPQKKNPYIPVIKYAVTLALGMLIGLLV